MPIPLHHSIWVFWQPLRRLADQRARIGDAEGALQTIKLLAPGSRLSWIVIARAEGGDINGAMDWLTILKDQDDKATALEELARLLTNSGRESLAKAAVLKQDDGLLRAYTLLGIAMGHKLLHNRPQMMHKTGLVK